MKTYAGHGSFFFRPLIAILALSLIAFWLRVVGIASLSMWGDSSYSVYSANLGLLRILTERINDGHPPLYYYLLHFWSLMTGNSELSVRFLSLFWGVLTVPLAVVVGRRIGGEDLRSGSGLAGDYFSGVGLLFPLDPHVQPCHLFGLTVALSLLVGT